MKCETRQLLTCVKTQILNELKNTLDIDKDQLEYIIELIDYILTGVLPLDDLIFPQLLEEILIAATYQENYNILLTLKELREISKDVVYGNKV